MSPTNTFETCNMQNPKAKKISSHLLNLKPHGKLT